MHASPVSADDKDTVTIQGPLFQFETGSMLDYAIVEQGK